MIRALMISATVVAGLLLVIAWVRDPARWPAAELIPCQGEATEAGRTAHSPRALGRLIREPQNTWSNVAYVFAGALLLGRAQVRLVRMTGVPLIAVGVGSFLYHASASATLRFLDVAAMYWLFALLLLVGGSVAAPGVRSRLDRTAVALMAGCAILGVGLALARNVTVCGLKPLGLTVATAMTAAVLVLTLARVIWRRSEVSGALQLLGIVNVFGLAAFLQVSDRPGGAFYRPDATVQAHALWHALSAAAVLWAVGLLEREMRTKPATV